VSPSTLYGRVQALAKEGHSMSFAERINVCISVGTALKVMHSNEIYHGGLSPMNVHIVGDKQNELGYNLVQVSAYGFFSVLSSYHRNKSPLVSGDSSSSLNITEPRFILVRLLTFGKEVLFFL